jgi:hypothetical protein
MPQTQQNLSSMSIILRASAMLRISVLASVTTMLCAVLIAAVCLVSKSNSRLPSDLDAYQCSPQPCWHQIYPGKTQFKEAQSILQKDSTVKITMFPENGLCWETAAVANRSCLWSDTNGSVTSIDLDIDTSLRLGDIVRIFGQPINVMTCWMDTVYVTDKPPMFVYIYFSNGTIVRSSSHFPFLGGQLVPDQLIDSIIYDTTPGEPPDIPAWHGFSWLGEIPNSKYCA